MTTHSLLVKQLPCICCEIEGQTQPLPTHAHHLNLGGHAGQKRRGDEYQIPLCAWHHVGEPVMGSTASEMTYVYGPSYARSSKRFRELYGDDETLWNLTNERLKDIA